MVDSHKANYSVHTGNHIKDKHNKKTRDKLQANTGERKHINIEKVGENDEEKYTKNVIIKNHVIQEY
jgi:hypothetical protein